MAKKNTAPKVTSELKLKFIDSQKFIDFLNKFKVFDNNLLIEFRGSENVITSKVFNAAKSVIKFCELNFSDIFEIREGEIPEDLRLAIYNIDKLIQIFNLISNDEVYITFSYEQDDTEKDVYYITKFVLLTKTLKYIVPCGEKTLLNYMSNETAEKVFDIEEYQFKFQLDKQLLDKIKLFSEVDFGENISVISIKDKNMIVFNGSSYNLKYEGEFEIQEDANINIAKEFFKFLDKEEYTVYSKVLKAESDDIKELIFTGNISNFKIAMAQSVEEDDNE